MTVVVKWEIDILGRIHSCASALPIASAPAVMEMAGRTKKIAVHVAAAVMEMAAEGAEATKRCEPVSTVECQRCASFDRCDCMLGRRVVMLVITGSGRA